MSAKKGTPERTENTVAVENTVAENTAAENTAPADDAVEPTSDEAAESDETAEPTWHMPPETAPQDRVWMAFPPAGGYLGESADDIHEARTAWSAVANAVLDFEHVTVVVDPLDLGIARRYLASGIDVIAAPLNDAWMRDIGPTFVLDESGGPGSGELGAVTWRFNGWGGQDWARWDDDAVIGAVVAARSGARRVLSDLVGEGGGINVDGLGTVLLTETVQLDPGRNPGRSKAKIEAEYARTLGATNPIWFRRGLFRDSQRFGTRGHVDILATIPSPGRVLVHSQRDKDHPDYEVSQELVATLQAARTPEGAEWEILELPAPQVLTDAEGFVDYSYVNHLAANGAVIACTFDDANDAEALDVLREAYPGREIVGVDARAIFARGGGIHCITQQQPTPGLR
jgi:agmatine deiminase